MEDFGVIPQSVGPLSNGNMGPKGLISILNYVTRTVSVIDQQFLYPINLVNIFFAFFTLRNHNKKVMKFYLLDPFHRLNSTFVHIHTQDLILHL